MLEDFTIIHTADWHVCDEKLEDARKCLGHLTAKAEKIKPDLIVIAGDIYNHRQVRQESEAARLAFSTIKTLANVSPVAILLGTPSHDGQAPLLTSAINEDYPVWVANLPEAMLLCVEKFGSEVMFSKLSDRPPDTMEPVAFISAVPAFTKQYFQTASDIQTSDQEIATALGNIFAGFGGQYHDWSRGTKRSVPHILMGHWAIGGAFVHPAQAQALTGLEIEVARAHIALAKPSIVCMGHIHAQQKLGSNIFYPGSLFATDFGEMEAKGFYFHALQLAGEGAPWGVVGSEFIHTPSPLLIKIVSDLYAVKQDATANVVLLQALKGLSPNPNAIIRHEIRIYQDMAHTIDETLIRETVAQKLGPREYQMNISRMPRPNVRSARVLHVESLRDKLQARAEIINEPVSEEILLKADALEAYEREQLLESVQKEVQA